MRAGVRGVLLRYGMTVGGGGGGVVFGGLAGWRRLQRQASSTSCPWSRVWRLAFALSGEGGAARAQSASACLSLSQPVTKSRRQSSINAPGIKASFTFTCSEGCLSHDKVHLDHTILCNARISCTDSWNVCASYSIGMRLRGTLLEREATTDSFFLPLQKIHLW